MPDINIGTWSGQDLILRQTGGRDDAVIESGEAVELVMRRPGALRETVLSPADRASVLAHLGIRRMGVGTRIDSLARYVDRFQANKDQIGALFSYSDFDECAREGNFGISRSWIRGVLDLITSSNEGAGPRLEWAVSPPLWDVGFDLSALHVLLGKIPEKF